MHNPTDEQVETVAKEICQREHFGPNSKGHGCGGRCQAVFWYGDAARAEIAARSSLGA